MVLRSRSVVVQREMGLFDTCLILKIYASRFRTKFAECRILDALLLVPPSAAALTAVQTVLAVQGAVARGRTAAACGKLTALRVVVLDTTAAIGRVSSRLGRVSSSLNFPSRHDGTSGLYSPCTLQTGPGSPNRNDLRCHHTMRPRSSTCWHRCRSASWRRGRKFRRS